MTVLTHAQTTHNCLWTCWGGWHSLGPIYLLSVQGCVMGAPPCPQMNLLLEKGNEGELHILK